MATVVREAAAAGEGTVVAAAPPDIEVIPDSPPPAAKSSPAAILRRTWVFLVQLTLFFWVDTFAALARRRPLAASAGRRMRIALVHMGPAYAKLARLMGSHAAVIPGPMLAGFDSRPEPTPKPLPATVVHRLVETALGPIASRSPASTTSPSPSPRWRRCTPPRFPTARPWW